eukprot:150664_1
MGCCSAAEDCNHNNDKTDATVKESISLFEHKNTQVNESISIHPNENYIDTVLDFTIENNMDEMNIKLTNDNELQLSDDKSESSFDAATFKHYKQQKRIYDLELVEWIQSNNSNFIIIDVRNTNMDYLGGHIKGAINIEHINFIKKIKELIEKYYKIKNIIFHCMYSQCRGPMCANWYCMALTALLTEFDINNISNQLDDHKQQSFMKICLNESEDFSELFDMKMNKEKYNYLCNQNIYILHLGFVHFANRYRNDTNLVIDFDEKFWYKQQFSDTLVHKNDW